MAAPAQPERTLRQQAEEESGSAMSFFDHLVELRKRLISALLAVGLVEVLDQFRVTGVWFSRGVLSVGICRYPLVPERNGLKRPRTAVRRAG